MHFELELRLEVVTPLLDRSSHQHLFGGVCIYIDIKYPKPDIAYEAA